MINHTTNLSDNQWQIISKNLDVARSRKYDLREVFNAVLYLVKAGCQWRLLPGDFPKWQTVYYYFSVWKKNDSIEVIHELLVEKIRKAKGRNEEPSADIIDAQSVKSTLLSCEGKGLDACKKIKGIKRHIIADTLGLVLAVVIQSASLQDRDGAVDVVSKMPESWKKVIKIFADRGELIKTIKTKFEIEMNCTLLKYCRNGG
jgi:putative transposase